MVIALLGSVTFGIIEAPGAGWTSPEIVAAFTVSLLSLVGLLVHESRREQPLLDVRFFRSIPFSASIALSVAAFASFGGFLFLNTLYLQDVRGLSPVEAGITVVPLALMIVLVSPLSGRIVGRRGPRLPLAIAGVCFAASCAMLTGIEPTTSWGWLLVAYTVFGLGFGFVNAPITNAAVSGMPVEQAGVAAAIATTSRQFGQAFGVAVVGAIVASHGGADWSVASRPAWWTLTAFGALVLLLGLLATGARARASVQRVPATVPA
jgi:MFS family permease